MRRAEAMHLTHEPTPRRKAKADAHAGESTDSRTHEDRVRESLAWALDEYAATLEKLAK